MAYTNEDDMTDPQDAQAIQDTDVKQDVTHGVEKFSALDLSTLRSELLRSGVDSFQAAEIVASFLTGRGYGCSAHEARSIASSIEVSGVTTDHIQEQLERVARVM